MRLYEEYLKRHNIQDVPLAHHCSQTSLCLAVDSLSVWQNVLKQNIIQKMPKYAILQIKWEHNDHHPGLYYVNISYPVHDGYLNDSVFYCHRIATLKWQEYEQFVLNNLIDHLQGTRIFHDFMEITIAAWEMFVLAYDSWFNKQSGELKYLLYESLDKDNDLEKRWGYCQELLRQLQNVSPVTVRCWKYDVFSRINNHSEWLAKLVEQKCKKTILQLG